MSMVNHEDEVDGSGSEITADELKTQLRERYGTYDSPGSDGDTDTGSDSGNGGGDGSGTPESKRQPNMYASEKRHIIWVPQTKNAILLQNTETEGESGIENRGDSNAETTTEDGSKEQQETKDEEAPLYVSLLGFTDSEDWKMGKGYYRDIEPEDSDGGTSGESEDSAESGGISFTDRKWDHFYGISHGDTTHVVRSEMVDSIAEIIGVSPPSLLSTARIRPDQDVYPIMFDEKIPGGKLIVLPIEDTETGGSPLRDLSF